MTKAMNARDSVKVVNDQKGSPTCAVNLASVIIKMIKSENQIPYGIYHCTDIGEITWWDFANKIYELGKKYNRITSDCVINFCTTAEYPTAAKRPAYSVLSKDKIQKALNITLPEWEESLESFIKSDRFKIK
jgi:dTDP-4-dehydrorhamnose reductase